MNPDILLKNVSQRIAAKKKKATSATPAANVSPAAPVEKEQPVLAAPATPAKPEQRENEKSSLNLVMEIIRSNQNKDKSQ